MYFQTPLHLSWFSTQWRPEASHWVHGGAISRRLMATFASWGACTVTSWSEEEKKDAAPERRRTLGWRVIWGQNIRGKLFRWYFQLLLWNLKTSSLRFKLDLMPPKRLVGRWMKTRRTKRLGEVCHSSSCDRRQIERHGENWPSPKISLCVKLAPHKINKSSKGSPQIKNGGLPKGDNVPFFTVFSTALAVLFTLVDSGIDRCSI